MTAQVTNKACGSPQTPVSLSFNHHTSAIKVKYTNDGASPVTITGISITGVKYSGTLNNGTWTLGSAVNSSTSNPFSLSLSTNVAAGATVDLTSTSNIFLMLPQTLPSGAKLIVTTSDNSYECNLSGSWVAGKSYTYHISVEGTTFYLNVIDNVAFDGGGGDDQYTIQSYKEKADGTQEPVAWTAKYSTNGGISWSSTKPSWLTAFTASGSGSITTTNYTVSVSANVASTYTPTEQLRANAAVADYDLSLHDVQGNTTTRNTANCYMVHAPGTYKLPLVYGNAIKNGETNTVAFDPMVESNSDTYLTPFLNHDGIGITDPWLKNNSATPDGASLIWQDVNGLISAVGIDGDYLTFTVSSTKIAEGNAVIAATKSGTVVWSWHIWVTNETFSNLTKVTNTAHSSQTYYVTPINLGWVNTSTRLPTAGYSIRSCIIKVTQSESGGEEKTFIIRQYNFITTGYNTYYQWGRKDPEIPSDGMNAERHAAYDITGNPVMQNVVMASNSLTEGIKNPLTHYYTGNYSSHAFNNHKYYNLWNGAEDYRNGVTYTVKTIYDPCPPGFCVPAKTLYTILYGTKQTIPKFKVLFNIDPFIWFPATGYVYRDGTFRVIGSTAYANTSTLDFPNNMDNRSISGIGYISNGNFTSTTIASKVHAYPIRPVPEK